MMIKFFSYTGVMMLLFSCSSQWNDGYLNRVNEFERNWAECYESRFNFPENPYINGIEYLRCNLDGRNVLLNDHTTGFEATVRFEFGWKTDAPGTVLSGNEGAQNWLHITFLHLAYWKQIAIVVKYPTDSLNYTIQNTFKAGEIKCSSNFIEDGPRFDIMSICDFGSATFFSTLYSPKENQNIHIDRFTYKFNNGKWNYHLEYSFDEIEITNVHWNSRTKRDIFGQERTSNYLIENLQVRDMECVIEFELPEG